MKRFYPINAGNNRFVTKKNEKNKRNEEKNDVFGHQAHNVFFYKLRHCTTQNAYCCSKIGDSDLHPVIRFLNNRMARSEPFYHAGMGFSCLIVIDAHQQQVVSVLSHLRRIILPFNLGDSGISGLVLLQFHY